MSWETEAGLRETQALVDIKGLDRADVLAALYNASKPMGRGLLHFDPKPMLREEAAMLLQGAGSNPSFDYVKGRVLKITFSSGRWLDARLYDRDNGPGAATRAIEDLWERLTRPVGETACCPMCAGSGVVSKQEAERWADVRLVKAWQKEGRSAPPADAEVDEGRFRQMELSGEPKIHKGVDWGVGDSRTIEVPLRSPADVAPEVPSIELSQAKPKLPTSAIDEDRFRMMGEKEKLPQVWQVLIAGQPVFWKETFSFGRAVYQASKTPLEFPTRKEALTAANRIRQTERRAVTVENKDVLERLRAEAAEKREREQRKRVERTMQQMDALRQNTLDLDSRKRGFGLLRAEKRVLKPGRYVDDDSLPPGENDWPGGRD